MEKKTSKARKDGAAHGRKGGAQRRRYYARVLTVRASEIVPEPVRWVWPGIIARAKVTGLVGHPGLGKSQVATDLAATVSTGRPWPGGVANDSAGEVIVLSAEDDAADTGVPRLIAAGADRTRVNLVMAVEDRCGERRFNSAHDLDRLEKDLDLRGVNLLVIDPTSAYLNVKNGKAVDRNNGGDVRTVLDRLGTFAARHDIGVLAISHLNKSSGARAITRIMGSQEWAAAPRAAFSSPRRPERNGVSSCSLKAATSRPDASAFRSIENKLVGDGIRSSAVAWSNDPVTISADEALATTAREERDDPGAVGFLEEVLAEGPMDQSRVAGSARRRDSRREFGGAREKTSA